MTSDNFSRLALGTVQFGQAYGISNKKGQPKEQEVRDILDLAAANGVQMLDTAPAYGNAEQTLGRVLTSSDSFNIVTKTIALREIPATSAPTDALKLTFEKSLQATNQDSLYGLIVQLASDLLGPDGDKIWKALEDIKASGCVKKIGVSCYNTSEIRTLSDRYPISLIQTPFNIFDQALIQNGMIETLKAAGVEVHIRSALLQGLAVMDPDNLPDGFTRARKHVLSLRNAANSQNITPLELALGFVNSVKSIDQMVIGVTDTQELQGILDAISCRVIDLNDTANLATDDEAVITPSQWPPDTQESWAFDFSTNPQKT